MKRIISILLALVIVFSLALPLGLSAEARQIPTSQRPRHTDEIWHRTEFRTHNSETVLHLSARDTHRLVGAYGAYSSSLVQGISIGRTVTSILNGAFNPVSAVIKTAFSGWMGNNISAIRSADIGTGVTIRHMSGGRFEVRPQLFLPGNSFEGISHQRIITANGAPIRPGPAENSGLTRSVRHGQSVRVVGMGYNRSENLWALLEDGNWIFTRHLEPITDRFRITTVAEPAQGGLVVGNTLGGWGPRENHSVTAPLDYNTQVRLSAVPNNGWEFIGWYEGNTRVSQNAQWNINATSNRTFHARFRQTGTSQTTPQQPTTPTPTPQPPQNQSWNVTLRENQGRTSGTTNETVFQFRASTDFDASRVVIVFDNGTQFNMNRTNSRAWYLNSRLTTSGTRTITVHAYEGSTRRASQSMQITAIAAQQPVTPTPPQNQSWNVTLRENQGRTSGTTNETVFQFRASTDFDASRVVIVFDGGTQFNMNRTNSRAWYLNSRLTTSGTRTITVHAYEGSTRRASQSMQITATAAQQPATPTPQPPQTVTPPPAQVRTFTIRYDANGGTGAPASHSTTVIATNNAGSFQLDFTIPTARPTRSGHTFTGWHILTNDRPSVAPRYFQPGTRVLSWYHESVTSITFQAQWRRN